MFTKLLRVARRAILIYIATIVAPIEAFVWLGLQSFERQRQALRSDHRQAFVVVAGRCRAPAEDSVSNPITIRP